MSTNVGTVDVTVQLNTNSFTKQVQSAVKFATNSFNSTKGITKVVEQNMNSVSKATQMSMNSVASTTQNAMKSVRSSISVEMKSAIKEAEADVKRLEKSLSQVQKSIDKKIRSANQTYSSEDEADAYLSSYRGLRCRDGGYRPAEYCRNESLRYTFYASIKGIF